MAGPIETGGEVAKETVSALKTSPLILGTMLLQLLTIGILGWVSYNRNQYEATVNTIFDAHIQALIKQCGPIQRGDIPLPIPFPSDVPRG